jgi:mono/diheme cytochrome c family protein
MDLAFLIVAVMVLLFIGAFVVGSTVGVPGAIKEPLSPKVAPAATGQTRPGQIQQEAFAQENAQAAASRRRTRAADPDDSSGMRMKVMLGVLAAALAVIALGAIVIWEPAREAEAAERQLTDNVNRGARLFTTNCAKCHGPTGQGLVGPNLHLAEFAARYKWNTSDPADLQKLRDLATKTITHGRPGTVMPAWGRDDGGPLNETQISNLVDLIATDDWAAVAAAPAVAVPAAAATPAPAASGGDPAVALMTKYGCGGCHTISTIPGAVGTVGPNLSKEGANPKVPMSTGALDNNPANLAKWIFNAPAIKPGISMPNFSSLSMTQDEADKIAAYLETLK